MKTGGRMTCKEVVELVTDYLEGELSAHDFQRFEEHLETCKGCTVYLEQMNETIRLTGRLTDEEVSDDVMAHLLETFRGWDRPPGSGA